MAEEKPLPWMDELFPEASKLRDKQRQDASVFAQRYLVFKGPTSDPRARELFEHWVKAVRRARLPKNASASELAAHNAMREFLEGIDAQIDFAKERVNEPWLET
jgi:hypothetical protein